MKPENQRIAIAEACGWKFSHMGSDQGMAYPLGDFNGRRRELPDYLNDLNAMYEAEKILLEGHQIISYLQHLSVTKGNYGQIWMAVNATAAQRAEAFLRTLGKWKD